MRSATIQVKVSPDEKWLIERYIAKQSYEQGTRATVSSFISESIVRLVIADLVEEARSHPQSMPKRLQEIYAQLNVRGGDND